MTKSLKIKILFVMQLPPPVHGVSVMNKLIYDSKIINKDFDCDFVNLATAKNIDDLQKAGIKKLFTTVLIIFKTISKIIFNRYAYVYITIFPWGFAFIKDSLIVLIAKLFRLKVLLHLHTHGFKTNSSKGGLRKGFYKFVFKNTEVICLSDLLIEDIEDIYQGKVYILPNGIPQVNFKNTYLNNQEPINILYLSNLIKGKGILLIIEAAEILKAKGYRFLVRVAGPEGDVSYKQLQSLIQEKGLAEIVSLLGPKFGQEKYEEFRNAGIFLLPSNYDTFGLVLLEAMQFGVPSIATNVGGIPDVLGDGRGIIIPEITAMALAEAIAALISDGEKRERISKTGFKYFEENFTTAQFESKLRNILMEVPDRINTRLTLPRL